MLAWIVRCDRDVADVIDMAASRKRDQRRQEGGARLPTRAKDRFHTPRYFGARPQAKVPPVVPPLVLVLGHTPTQNASFGLTIQSTP